MAKPGPKSKAEKAAIAAAAADKPEKGIPVSGETIIKGRKGAVGIAIRTAETETEFRMLITIRAGFDPSLIKFDFGNYGSGGVQTFGGGDGPPPCP